MFAAAWLLTALTLGLFTAPLAAEAQQAGQVYRIGYLQTSTREEQLHLVKAFEDGLRDLGYRVGQNAVIEYRFAEARPERLPGLAADLVRLNVDVIVTGMSRSLELLPNSALKPDGALARRCLMRRSSHQRRL